MAPAPQPELVPEREDLPEREEGTVVAVVWALPEVSPAGLTII